MSRYLQYVLERKGMNNLAKVSIVQQGEDWVNEQLRDEFRNVLGDAEIDIRERPEGKTDLLVLPYKTSFAEEYLPLAKSFKEPGAHWIMLYGVTERVISIMPAADLSSYCRKENLLKLSSRLNSRTRKSTVIKALLRWWLKLRLLNVPG